jgi:hypothetical protein
MSLYLMKNELEVMTHRINMDLDENSYDCFIPDIATYFCSSESNFCDLGCVEYCRVDMSVMHNNAWCIMRSNSGDWVFHHIKNKKCCNGCSCADSLYSSNLDFLEILCRCTW